MKNYFKYLILAGTLSLLIFFQQGCKKDRVKCLNCDKCENFPEPDGGISTIKQKEFQRKAPCFNPNNGNEFIYIKEEGRNQTLVKYNLSTNHETILLENAQIIGQPKWGKNKKIVYTGTEFQINIINDNGNNHNVLTNNNSYLYPDWLNDSVISTEFSFNLGVPYFYCELSIIGNIIDTIRGSSFTFGSNNLQSENACLLYASDPNINIRKRGLFVSSLTNFENDGRNTITGICWHPNNSNIYYSTYREGLYVINKNTKERKKIRNGCDSRSYRFLSISPDGKKILVERVDATDYKNNNGNWTEEAKIYIMDIDGKNERDVFK
jgi:Tol biopolymer transport system component